MTDSITHSNLKVSAAGGAGPYIVVPVHQLDTVTSILKANGISFWVDANAISIGGKPEITVVNFGLGADAALIQQLLDAVR